MWATHPEQAILASLCAAPRLTPAHRLPFFLLCFLPF